MTSAHVPDPSLWRRLWAWRHRPLARWLATGLAFMGFTSLLLYVAVDLAGLSVAAASLLAAEVATILRFWINEYWVFKTRTPTWVKLGQFHVANAGATAIWWTATNLLDRLGIHHVLAAILAVGCSTVLSLGVNFLWIWRKPAAAATKP